jgi:hypothetical protein
MGKTTQIERPRHMIVREATRLEQSVERRHGRIGIAGLERLGRSVQHPIRIAAGRGRFGRSLRRGAALGFRATETDDGA